MSQYAVVAWSCHAGRTPPHSKTPQIPTLERATGAEVHLPYCLALLGEVHGKVGQAVEGLSVLAEALALVNKTGERFYETELYRLKGELTLQQFNVQGSKFKVTGPRSLASD